MPTTDTFYPDPHTESTSVDGFVYRESQDVAWATIHDHTDGTSHSDSATVAEAGIQCSATANQFSAIYRYVCLFDTSALDNAATISAATLSLYISTHTHTLTDSITAVASTPASNTDLANGDYDQFGTTALSDSLDIATQLATGAYRDWTLNAAGLAAISLTSVTKLGLRSEYDRTNTAPAWSSGVQSDITLKTAETTNTTSDPKLAVTYDTGTTYQKACDALMACVATRTVIVKLARSRATACVATLARSAMTFHRSFTATTACVATKARFIRKGAITSSISWGQAQMACVATTAKKISIVRAATMACVSTIGKGVKLARAATMACAATAAETYHAAGGVYTKALDALMACIATCTRIVRRHVGTISVSEAAIPVYTVSEATAAVLSVAESVHPVYTVGEELIHTETA